MNININNMVTDVFWMLQSANQRYVLCFGGSGSSKSYSMHQLLILKSFKDEYDTLIIRKTGASIRRSVFEGLKDRIKSFKMQHLFEFRYSNDNRVIINKVTGRQLIFSGLDDPEKVKSIENISRVFIEEANQISKSDFGVSPR